jgi:hypothetical protein
MMEKAEFNVLTSETPEHIQESILKYIINYRPTIDEKSCPISSPIAQRIEGSLIRIIVDVSEPKLLDIPDNFPIYIRSILENDSIKVEIVPRSLMVNRPSLDPSRL